MGEKRVRPPLISGKAVGLTALGLLLFVGLGALVAHLAIPAAPDNAAIVGAAQYLVKARFVAGSAHFSNQEETAVDREGEEKVRVSGTVDVVAPDGTGARYSYTVLMHQNPDFDWIADDVSLIPI